MWHIKHGTILHTSLKNNNNCYLLLEQPSSHHSHATSCASLSVASSSHNFHTLTKSLHSELFYTINQLLAKNSISINYRTSPKGASTSSRVLYIPPTSKRTTALLALLLISVRGAFITTHVFLPSHLSGTLITNASSSHIHHSELYIFLLQLAHLPRGASTRPRVPYCLPQHNGLATLLAILLIAVRDPLLTTSSPLKGSLLTRLSLKFHHLLVFSKSNCHSR